ncbi:MAG TPA: hypothetical protein VMU61_08125 [Candidatus Aquilonibacter sp.]|nr:hypothetical protein [Candidatus Aquilonibacter sp.]
MTLAIILVIAATISLGVILRIAIARNLQLSTGEALAAKIHPLDVEAFRNLIHPAEEAYLRRRLTPAQFRMVQRQRLRAMSAYVRIAAGNAAALVQIGYAALGSDNPQTAEAAHRLVEQALLLRRNTALALARIYFALAFPGYGLGAAGIADSYERLSTSAMLLGRLQNPVLPVRISATR